MCGIGGCFLRSSSESQHDITKTLESMAGVITHRGPDDTGIHIDGPIGFAHTRLSIIDLANGHQPMLSQDKNIVLAFNGEIFNYIELREQLVKLGHTFRTHSDTEVILQMYIQYGKDFVSQLNGQFSIAIWDKQKQSLLLFRDRIGICPLYFTFHNNNLYFASEIKSLLAVPEIDARISHQSLDQLFTFWAPLSPNTIFENIYELPPGEQMEIDRNAYNTRKYWDFDFPVNPEDFDTRPENELIDDLSNLLYDATKIRLRSDVEVGAYLSGGLDSSLITSMIHQITPQKLKTFSIEFSDNDLDESSHQATLVSKINADHHSIRVSPENIAQNFVSTLWNTETPILRTAPVPMGLLSGLVRQHNTKVVLSGEGADEVFGGYDIFKEAKVRQFWARQPESEWRPLLLKKLYPYLKLPKGKSAAYLRSFFGEGLDSPDLLWHSHIPRWTTTAKAKQFFSQDLKDSLNETALNSFSKRMPGHIEQFNWLNRAQYIETKTLMGSYLLTSQGDRMLMKNSVEGRFPFLDHRVMEFANKLPLSVKIKGLNEKYILKKVAKNILPDSIIQRHKQPYRAPDVLALTQPCIPEYARYLLSKDRLKQNGYFDEQKVQLLLKKAEKGRISSIAESQTLVGILSTQIIHELFINNSHPTRLTL